MNPGEYQEDMGVVLNSPLVIVVDNTAAIHVAENVGVSAKTKHFEQCHHYLRQLVQNQSLSMVHVMTQYQKADGFTKGLDRTKYLTWVKQLYNFSES